jgi:hypothetical protein
MRARCHCSIGNKYCIAHNYWNLAPVADLTLLASRVNFSTILALSFSLDQTMPFHFLALMSEVSFSHIVRLSPTACQKCCKVSNRC